MWIEVGKDVNVERPIAVVNISIAGGTPQVTSCRVIVDVGLRAKLTLIEGHYDRGESYAANILTQIRLAANANLQYVRMVSGLTLATHIGRTTVIQEQNSNLVALAVSKGSKFVRHDFQVITAGAGAEVSLFGAYVLKGQQHLDNHTFIEHRVGNTKSRQIYRGVLTDQARAVFNGKVLIDQGANGADSSQLAKHMLMSSQAEVDAKPELIVHADDVKATHGASVGQINPEEVFYLRSRGIDQQTAEQMLSLGFVTDGLFAISHLPTRQWLLAEMTKEMP